MPTIGIVGAGRIGGNIARRATEAGDTVLLSYTRDAAKLERLASEIGPSARAVQPAEAAGSDIVVLSVPWNRIDEALAQAGSLSGRVVVDTTNPYSAGGLATLPEHETTGRYNAKRILGAKLVKAFNTYTSGFQVEAASNAGRIAMFFWGDEPYAKRQVAALIRTVGFDPVDLGSLDDGALMDAPRRDGSVYGEAYLPEDARQIAALLTSDPQRASALALERRQKTIS